MNEHCTHPHKWTHCSQHTLMSLNVAFVSPTSFTSDQTPTLVLKRVEMVICYKMDGLVLRKTINVRSYRKCKKSTKCVQRCHKCQKWESGDKPKTLQSQEQLLGSLDFYCSRKCKSLCKTEATSHLHLTGCTYFWPVDVHLDIAVKSFWPAGVLIQSFLMFMQEYFGVAFVQ